MIPESLDPFSYLLRSSVRKIEKRQMPTCTYMVAKKAAIVLKISTSLFGALSNPGVSMRITGLPSRVNTSVDLTSAVHQPTPVSTGRFEPLARLINWKQLGEFLIIVTGHTLLTEVFPLPVSPIILLSTIWMRYARDGDGLEHRGWPTLACAGLLRGWKTKGIRLPRRIKDRGDI